MKKALLSVYNKTGIVDFARELIKLGFEIISSGGTAKVLSEAGLEITDVAKITGRPPVLGHRVVTLDSAIHGGLLATKEQKEELASFGWPWIDLVCVDLYPLEKTTKEPAVTREKVIESTDIGGPTLLRSAAKGRRIVIADPADWPVVISWLKEGLPNYDEFITRLAAKAEMIVANYCLISARYYSQGKIDGLIGEEILPCKYGENPWQGPAGLYTYNTNDPLALDKFHLVEGDRPSYINWCDLDRLLQTMTHLATVFYKHYEAIPYIAIGVKHGNPCGTAFSWNNRLEAIKQMLKGDPLAIFGGVVMTNFIVDTTEAECLRQWQMPENQKRLLDGVVAPSFSESAKTELNRKGGKCRLLENPALDSLRLSNYSLDLQLRLRPVRGGFLKQPNYYFIFNFTNPDLQKFETELPATEIEKQSLLLAWAVGTTSNSNTITLVKNGMLIGNGVGQQDRVGAAKLAIERAYRSNHDIVGAVAYSDSFFPFPDGVAVLADAGIKVILTSSGSVNDQKIISLCQERKITLYMIPDIKGRGFFGH